MLIPLIDGKAHGPKLHGHYGIMPVTPMRRRREPDDVVRLDFVEHTFERHRRHVVTFVDNHLPIARDDVINAVLADQALDHGDVNPPGTDAVAAADLADLFLVHSQEHRQLSPPLVQERLPMHQDERAARARPGQIEMQRVATARDVSPRRVRRDDALRRRRLREVRLL